jgi:hypothetical protein
MKMISTPVLPDTSSITLHLLREEIRFRKLARIFEQAKLDIHMHAPDLASLILTLTGFEEHTDELYSWYFEKLDEYVGLTLGEDHPDLKTHSLNFFVDLQIKNRSTL